tara:strand:- start:11 stop:349 length:339 start_codon:yes stop_codon:yes gene_type:complete
MAVYTSNIIVNTGTDFNQIFTLEDGQSNSALNLTSFDVKAQMRKHPTSSGVTTFTATIYSASDGQIQLGLSTTTTSSLKEGRYMYDVVLTDTSNVMSRVLEGSVMVTKGVTQ